LLSFRFIVFCYFLERKLTDCTLSSNI